MKHEQLKFEEIEFRCPICGKKHTMLLNPGEYERYRSERYQGKCIQDIFPDMCASNREKFITGICDECQKSIFGD